ncbi:putative Alpha amylase catalytic domain / Fn3-associated multi-domain protein [uncultured Paludibacter sp.]|uniref:Putative Alpha amylase catalytic domain / Fn3-associated multi-domain protein n=1 Tax=uncultured Paludibacter sp. TaxID=497635 RepID=A0A653AKE4_9BACT|nr:putative Alpha amylase catalytic domain / Fn3-associated multi-domain protein [uncultured Paludibacter sp.]
MVISNFEAQNTYINTYFNLIIMKKTFITLFALFLFFYPTFIKAQAPAQATDVMLQAFYWDSYSDSKWTTLNSQASELAQSFTMLWLPPSGDANSPYSNTMGYTDVYWFKQNSSFGTQTELQTLISNLKSQGTRCIADIVINHRNGVTSWTDFPSETYNGVTYTWGSWAICNSDECVAAGYAATGAPEGYKPDGTRCDDFGGARDLDHSNVTVQNTIKAYLQFMKNDMGYDGWRYDMTKGYPANYTAMYNDAAGAYYSVGEYWDGAYDPQVAWIDATSKKSTTFDWSFKYALNNASGGDLTKLVWTYNGANQPAGIIHNPNYRRYATTFIDNHDTYRDSNKFTGDVLMANAFMICSPGIPCVFLPHWKQYKSQIQAMIAARRAVQVHSESAVTVNQSASNLYVATVTGKTGSLIVKLGSGSYSAPSDYTLATSGNDYAIWTKGGSVLPILTVTPASGTYITGQTVTMTATGSADIYYTSDGTTPTSSSTKYTSPITLPVGPTTVKAIAINANGSSSVTSNSYTIVDKKTSITVRFKAPTTWTSVDVYVWEVINGTASELLGKWPGTAVTKDAAGYYTYTVTNFTQPTINVIFNNANKGEQTVDLSTTDNICWNVGSVAATSPNVKYNADVDASCVTAVEKIPADNWKIYPNPTSGILHLDLPETVNKVVISSVLGAKIKELEVMSKQIDISSYPSGMYFITISDNNGAVSTKPIMKK